MNHSTAKTVNTSGIDWSNTKILYNQYGYSKGKMILLQSYLIITGELKTENGDWYIYLIHL